MRTFKGVFYGSFILIFGCFQVEAVTTDKVFAKYRNKYFVETGSHVGDGIAGALKAGYSEVYSIELSPHYYEVCKKRFAGNSHVHLVLGDSSTALNAVLQNIDGPATFWLDGHFSGGDTAKGSSNSPIIAELKAIEKHGIKNHTILIDDTRQLGTQNFDFVSMSDLVKQILKINPQYMITFEDGYVPNDVLVAKVTGVR